MVFKGDLSLTNWFVRVLRCQNDSKVTTAAARKAFMKRFEREVDPDGVLTDAEIRRAEHAMKAHMLRLSHKAAISNKKK